VVPLLASTSSANDKQKHRFDPLPIILLNASKKPHYQLKEINND